MKIFKPVVGDIAENKKLAIRKGWEMSKVSVFFFVFICLLSGCDSATGADAKTVVRQNSYPLIIDTVSSMVPQLSRTKNGDVLNEICSVVYGGKSQADLDSWLKSNFTGIDKLSNETEGDGVLTGADKVAQRTACAAWLSFSLKFIPDINGVKTKDKEGNEVIDEKKLLSIIPVKLAVAITNAEIFSDIAVNLEKEKPSSVQKVKEKIRKLFEKNASRYLESVKTYAAQGNGQVFNLLLFQKGRFAFQDDNGYLFDVSPEGLNLFRYGVSWLSKGKLQGVDYYISIPSEQ